MKVSSMPKPYFSTKRGKIYLGDSLGLFDDIIGCKSVDLIVTSPPFGLVRKKKYGNVDADKYLDWFRPFAEKFYDTLKDSGSLVIDIGGSWVPGQPTRSLYHYELLIMLCKEYGFHLAQEFFWWNPSKLPSPAEWVNIRRIRVKDSVNCVWWLSKTPWPKASNKRVPYPYSSSMKALLKNGYKAKLRPSGHDISENFGNNNGSSIAPNLIAIANTESNSKYSNYCKQNNIPIHPARFPQYLPEYFIRMLTDKGDLVVDPFAGSCITGEVAEKLGRSWICGEILEDYLKGALCRLDGTQAKANSKPQGSHYKIFHPAAMWSDEDKGHLRTDGGRTREKK